MQTSQTNCSAVISLETQQSLNAEHSPNPGHSFTAKSRRSRMIRGFLKALCVVQDLQSWLIPSYFKHRMVRMRGFGLERLDSLNLVQSECNTVAQNRCCVFRGMRHIPPLAGLTLHPGDGKGCFSSWFGQSRSVSGRKNKTDLVLTNAGKACALSVLGYPTKWDVFWINVHFCLQVSTRCNQQTLT